MVISLNSELSGRAKLTGSAVALPFKLQIVAPKKSSGRPRSFFQCLVDPNAVQQSHVEDETNWKSAYQKHYCFIMAQVSINYETEKVGLRMKKKSHSGVYEIAADYLRRLGTGIAAVEVSELEAVYEMLLRVRAVGGTVWICGNGGSSATASHMQVDLAYGVKPGVRARSMADNSAALTATGNDVSYEKVFSRQLELEGSENDMLIVISASGNSANLIEAVASAKDLGMPTCGFLGFDGGKLKQIVDIAVHTPTRQGDYGVAEDLHASLNHILKEMLNGFRGNGEVALP